MVASQIVRLQQTDAALWLAADYSGRLASLAILFLAPATRAIAFKREAVVVRERQAGLWLLGLLALQLLLLYPLNLSLEQSLWPPRLGVVPPLHGVTLAVDVIFGVALVAVHEEIVFRRVVRELLRPTFGDGTWMIIVSAILFGLYHWQFGAATIVAAALFGVFAMLGLCALGHDRAHYRRALFGRRRARSCASNLNGGLSAGSGTCARRVRRVSAEWPGASRRRGSGSPPARERRHRGNPAALNHRLTSCAKSRCSSTARPNYRRTRRA